MLQDIRTVNRKIHARYPELPVILMGHSMGSLAVRAFIAEHDSCVDMLIVCGSPSYNTAMPLGVGIAKLEKTLLGSRHRSKLIEAMSFGAGVAKFRKDKTCTAWICSVAGDKVKQGDLLMEVDLDKIQAAGLNTITPVLICNTDTYGKIALQKKGEVTLEDAVLKLS